MQRKELLPPDGLTWLATSSLCAQVTPLAHHGGACVFASTLMTRSIPRRKRPAGIIRVPNIAGHNGAQSARRTHQAQYNNRGRDRWFLCFSNDSVCASLRKACIDSPSGGTAYTSEVVGLQLQSFLLLPKADGIFQQRRYALFKRRFGTPLAILSGDGINEEAGKVAEHLVVALLCGSQQ